METTAPDPLTAEVHPPKQGVSTVPFVGADRSKQPDDAEPLDPRAKAALDRDFEDLYREHVRDVYSFAYYRVGNHHDAEDLTEQAFLQAYRHFERARRESDGRSMRPWLIRIVQNLAINHFRDRSRRPQAPIDLVEPVASPDSTERIAEDREELDRIMQLIRELPDDRREALIMRFALGMDNREIARAMGRSDGATKVLLHRAVKQLEGMVEADSSAAVASTEGGAD